MASQKITRDRAIEILGQNAPVGFGQRPPGENFVEMMENGIRSGKNYKNLGIRLRSIGAYFPGENDTSAAPWISRFAIDVLGIRRVKHYVKTVPVVEKALDPFTLSEEIFTSNMPENVKRHLMRMVYRAEIDSNGK